MDRLRRRAPFRPYEGAGRMALNSPPPRVEPTYDQLFTALTAQAVDRAAVSRLFHDSLALSAWKQVRGGPSWSLRVNPSSGALHPTEGYLIAGPVRGISESAGVFHYAPYLHALERRRAFDHTQWAALAEGCPPPCLFVALPSIHCRDTWQLDDRRLAFPLL